MLPRLAVAAGLAILLGSLAPAAARAENLTLSYLVAWGHLTLAEAEVSYRQSGSRYRLAGNGRTLGALGLLFPWHGKAETEGVIKAGARQPLVHQQEGTWKRNTRWARVAWHGAAPPKTEAQPPSDLEKVTPVPKVSTIGTSDPFTVLLSVLDRLAATGRCETEAKIWDGRRRYNLSVTHLGAENLIADRPWTYQGEAVRCALDYERIGGFWREPPNWRDPDAKASDRRMIWVAETAPDRWVLVRAEMETLYGTVVGRLLSDGGPKTDGEIPPPAEAVD